MRLSFILALVAAAIPLASAANTCYSAGPNTINDEFAMNNLNNTCISMIGLYLSEQQRYACVTQGETGVHWYFNIKRIADNDDTLTMDQCVIGMRKPIKECELGGHFKDDDENWDFRADPNKGTCKDQGYIDDMIASGVITVTKRDVQTSTVYEEGIGEPTTTSAIPSVM
ncbi:hypothetical protein FQN54_008729 [Arachnomyces sp. PD_36]|nr:hypothetical protein FQN54_008729 [Arachnomyces sp. PD_36]